MLGRLLLLTGACCVAALLWPIPTTPAAPESMDDRLLAGKREYLRDLQTGAQSTGPNVLLILADDLSPYDLSSNGASGIPTPNLDALAAGGVSFDNAYANAAICAPSRAALLTGRYQNRFGFESQPMQRYVRNLGEYLGFRYLIDTDAMRPFLQSSYPDTTQRSRQGLPAGEISLAEVFAAKGYATGIFGKWHLGYGPSNGPGHFGFQTRYGFREAFTLYALPGTPDIIDHTQDLFWERHIRDMGRDGPSRITRNDEPIEEDRYLTDAIVEETRHFIIEAGNRGQPFFAYVPFSAPHTPFQARSEDYEAIDPGLDRNHRVYAAMIRRLDRGVGELVNALAERQLLNDTLIIFSSDNGGADYTGATGNGPLRGGKFTQFEGGLRVPLIIYHAGTLAARTDPRPVLLSDLFATLLSQLDVRASTDRVYDSADLLGRQHHTETAAAQRMLFWRSDFNRAVRDGRWKLLENRNSHQVLLFDLDKDPGERLDLSAREPDRVRVLLEALDVWEQDMQPARWPRVMDYEFTDESGSHWFAI